jgi:hypothetical protein
VNLLGFECYMWGEGGNNYPFWKEKIIISWTSKKFSLS